VASDKKPHDNLDAMRHSASHVMADAVVRLMPGTKLAIGPAIEDGFYYDFEAPRTFTEDDLAAIENEMAEIVKADIPFERREVPKAEARRILQERGESYKLELLDDIEGDNVSFYRHGDFEDMCAGPHVESTCKIGAFKLLSVAGAYWRGDEKRQMLQRIYGTTFPDRKQLKQHLALIEEAKKRDHRRLGKDLDLFSIDDEVGPGLVILHPHGATVRAVIEDFWRSEHQKRGYQLIFTPHIARVGLWEKSGHLSHFSDMMYSPMDVDGQMYMIKPMNCPFHIKIFKSQLRSYRDLPIRLCELGTVYRYERSGVLHGMLRVRGFTQDDAHIFCTPEQVKDEIFGVLDFALFMMKSFGYSEFHIEQTARDPENKDKYLGGDSGWELGESVLRQALDERGIDYVHAEGEAKFYGPSIDIKVKDALGRYWQGPTIQFDFNLPERLDVNYIGPDGAEHPVIMIHRTVLGSMERFIAGLIEDTGGALPVWLAPVQGVVIPITDDHLEYAESVAGRLRERGLRVDVDRRSEKMGWKIRQATTQKVPYMLIVGDKEREAGQVAVRARTEGDQGPAGVEEFAERLLGEVAARG